LNNHLTSLELAVISEIEATSSLLKLVTRLTGMGFSAIAKVTDTTWMACAVHDEVQFGVEPGHQMQIEETICNELRLHRTPIVISEVACDAQFAEHPIPKLFGFQSYFSLPIIFPDGHFFGTLCGLDPQPAKLDNPEVLDTLKVFCTLLASTLYAHEQLFAARHESDREPTAADTSA
jgi:GAF domain-containing protein